ncbi:MAG: DNA primase catalytic subunit PriS, partial [Thermoplasmata archaeon]|nr:DNA primase catalytic subunit PriS [Thermoplasmata archaeon]
MDNEVSFLKSCFAEYYSNHGVTPPERFDRREYAFMPFGAKLMKRHISFKRRKDLQSFITKMVPAHIYYSSAFYRYPDAPTMEEKGWMGAELIFDLDMDHLKKG